MLPGEIVKIIMDFSVAGKRKLDVGFYSIKKLDQICEGIQRRKFLTLINTITVSLFNTILFNKMELGMDTNTTRLGVDKVKPKGWFKPCLGVAIKF